MQMFDWHSRDRDAKPELSSELKRLWAACKAGEPVKVRSSYGKPPPGYRGMFYYDCGCGYCFSHVQNKGYRIADRNGKRYIVDAMALHLVHCHSAKLDSQERALLAALPNVDEIENPGELEEILFKFPQHRRRG